MKEPRWSALSIAKVENARIGTHHPTSCPFLSQSKIHRWDLDLLSPVNHTFNKQPMNSWIKPQHLGQREFFSSTNSLRPIAASHWNGDMNKVMDSQSPLPHDLNLFPFTIQLIKHAPLYHPSKFVFLQLSDHFTLASRVLPVHCLP